MEWTTASRHHLSRTISRGAISPSTHEETNHIHRTGTVLYTFIQRLVFRPNRRVFMSQTQRSDSFLPLSIGTDTRTYRDKRFVRTSKTQNYPNTSNSLQKPQQHASDANNERRCYNCGKSGHISKNCKQKRYQQKTDQSKNMWSRKNQNPTSSTASKGKV